MTTSTSTIAKQTLFAFPPSDHIDRTEMEDDSFSSSSSSSTTNTSPSQTTQQQQEEQRMSSNSSSNIGRSWFRSGRLTKGVFVAMMVAAIALTLQPPQSYAMDLPVSTASAANLLSSVSQTGFYQAFSLVFVSEIGDKTFFIAGLLAMKTSRLISFIGSMGALAAMTVISVLIGQVFHAIPSGLADGVPLDDIAAVLAFLFFGFKTLQEALRLSPDAESTMDEELADAESTVQKTDVTRGSQLATIFALVFAAELGDRSFLSTIALSAAQNPVSVAVGALAAHAVATGIAVAGGSVVAKYLSERVIGIIGGTLFIVFAITTALGIF